jgi:hypothetical protein
MSIVLASIASNVALPVNAGLAVELSADLDAGCDAFCLGVGASADVSF